MDRSGTNERPRPAPPSAIFEPDPETTIVSVQEVLADLEAVSAAPLSEHVALFTSAHERLERVLKESEGR